MTNCLFFAVFFTLFSMFSYGSLKFSQVNRAFLSCYKGMFEASAVSVDDNGEPMVPYYDASTVRNYVRTYLESEIAKYVSDYKVTISYSKPIIKTSKYRAVTLNLTADINLLFKYNKSQTFTILS